MGRKAARFKYVGTESKYMKTGAYYTYVDIQNINGMLMTSIRSRMSVSYQDGERVITDEVLKTKCDSPFIRLDGKPMEQSIKRNFEDRCETDAEKMMNKYLRMAL